MNTEMAGELNGVPDRVPELGIVPETLVIVQPHPAPVRDTGDVVETEAQGIEQRVPDQAEQQDDGGRHEEEADPPSHAPAIASRLAKTRSMWVSASWRQLSVPQSGRP